MGGTRGTAIQILTGWMNKFKKARDMVEYLWILGGIIVVLIAAQGMVALYGTLRRTINDVQRRNLVVDLMRHRVGAAQKNRAELEQSAHTWQGYRKFEVKRKVDEGGGICSFYLVPHDQKAIPWFKPGQYLTFELHLQHQSKPLIRCYSLSDSPDNPHYRVTIKRIPPPRDHPDAPPGLVSSHFHEQINEGDILDVKAPAGHFFLDMSADAPVVLIGGGVGITPMLSMLNAIAQSDSTRETWFFYGVRNCDEHIMAEHLKQLNIQHDHIHLHVCYSDPRDGIDQSDQHYQHAARVSVDLMKRVLPSNNYDFFICGPPPMMAALTSDLDTWGVPSSRVHYESFGPATVKKLRAPEKRTEGIKTFDVTFTQSSKTCQWDPEADSLLDFAEMNDVAIDFGCRAGNCGTCLTAIRSGDIEYTTEPGYETEEGSCLACICIPKGPLELHA